MNLELNKIDTFERLNFTQIQRLSVSRVTCITHEPSHDKICLSSDYYHEHVILFELQHGFREKRSCETQLVMLVDEISKKMQMGKQTDLILLDFSKAFDKVAHEKLISKLHCYGIRGKTLSWVKDFLDSRSQAVKGSQIIQDSSIICCPAGLSPWTHTLPSIYK